ncbi:MAG TPA: POTRA domain-containing protein, partial [Candidatus Acidoferrum sp.]|nr:POTRA domain-containing protein [Candidatus Acidoferrum sp.]
MTTSLARIFNRLFLSLVVAGGVLFTRPVLGIQLEELDAARQWRVEKIEISGNAKFSDSEILRELLTKVRPWYLFWEAENNFDPITFREDLERIRRFYEARGYYRTQVTYDLTADPQSGQLEVKIEVIEGPPVIVSQVKVEVSGSSLSPPELPIKQGEIFVEESYRKGEETLRNFFLEHGYAHVTTERRAEVNLDQNQVIVWYEADPGPLSVFGETTVAGTDNVDPEIVLRELSYRPGEIFSPAKIAESQAKILALDLFGLVRIVPKEVSGKPSTVPM